MSCSPRIKRNKGGPLPAPKTPRQLEGESSRRKRSPRSKQSSRSSPRRRGPPGRSRLLARVPRGPVGEQHRLANAKTSGASAAICRKPEERAKRAKAEMLSKKPAAFDDPDGEGIFDTNHEDQAGSLPDDALASMLSQHLDING